MKSYLCLVVALCFLSLMPLCGASLTDVREILVPEDKEEAAKELAEAAKVFYEKMMGGAKEQMAKCPMQIGDGTVLANVDIEQETSTIVYSYELKRTEPFSTEEVENMHQEMVKSYVQSSPDAEVLALMMEITELKLAYYYMDEEGNELGAFVIDAADFNTEKEE